VPCVPAVRLEGRDGLHIETKTARMSAILYVARVRSFRPGHVTYAHSYDLKFARLIPAG